MLSALARIGRKERDVIEAQTVPSALLSSGVGKLARLKPGWSMAPRLGAGLGPTPADHICLDGLRAPEAVPSIIPPFADEWCDVRAAVILTEKLYRLSHGRDCFAELTQTFLAGCHSLLLSALVAAVILSSSELNSHFL